jgi:hypothetical protein
MADETTNTPEPQEPQLSPTEVRASEQGWVPKDQWQGEPEDWRPAKEFLDRGELFSKIDELKKENKRIRQGVEEFKRHNERVQEIAYKKALETLRAEKKQALLDGDADKVIEIDDKIAETREEQLKAAQRPPVQAEPTGPAPEFVRWESRNQWYKSDKAMKAVADDVARDLVGRGETDVTRILTEVDKEMRKAFPHKFENQKRNAPSAVEGTGRQSGKTSKDDFYLTDDERRIMNRIVATGAITKEKYIEQYKATKEAKGA